MFSTFPLFSSVLLFFHLHSALSAWTITFWIQYIFVKRLLSSTFYSFSYPSYSTHRSCVLEFFFLVLLSPLVPPPIPLFLFSSVFSVIPFSQDLFPFESESLDFRTWTCLPPPLSFSQFFFFTLHDAFRYHQEDLPRFTHIFFAFVVRAGPFPTFGHFFLEST